MPAFIPRVFSATLIFTFLLIGLWQGTGGEPQNTGLRILTVKGTPVANEDVEILCYQDAAATTFTGYFLASTDATGHVREGLPQDCQFVGVLWEQYRRPSGKPGRDTAYRYLYTSWQPGSRSPRPANGIVPVEGTTSLWLFDLSVSTEWAPGAGSGYLDNFQAGLRDASAYLYDLTDGQAAFGQVTVQTNGAGWNGADLRVRAANDYRPSAQVGGIVSATLKYTTPTGAETIYVPGEIHLGRFWDGFDAFDEAEGRWDKTSASRTLVHEWLHYAFFLYDEYQDGATTGRSEIYCTCPDLPQVTGQANAQICLGAADSNAASAMSYHYTASELWKDGLPDTCSRTDQQRVHGEPDWATLARFGDLMGHPGLTLHVPNSLVDGPELGMTGDLFGRSPTRLSLFQAFLPGLHNGSPQAGQRKATASEPAIRIALGDKILANEINNLTPQVYVRKPVSGSMPSRIMAQGTTQGKRDGPVLGQMKLLGIEPGDQLLVEIDRYGPAGGLRGRYRTSPAVTIRDGGLYTATSSAFDGTLQIDPGIDRFHFNALTVTLGVQTALPFTPTATLCELDAQIGCDRVQLMSSRDSFTWTTVFSATSAADLPHLGVVEVSTTRGAIRRWYQAAGGVGPAHMYAEAPVRDGPVMVDTLGIDDAPGFGHQVLIMPAAERRAVDRPLPAGVTGLLELPWDVDVLMPGAAFIATAQRGGKTENTLTQRPKGAEPQRTPESSARGDAGMQRRTALATNINADRVLPVPVVFSLGYSQEARFRLGLADNQLQLLHYDRNSTQWMFVPSNGRSSSRNWLSSRPVDRDGIYAVAIVPGPAKFVVPAIPNLTDPFSYYVVVPTPSASINPVEAFVTDQLSPYVQIVSEPICSIGSCSYDENTRTVQWQGQLEPGAVLTLEIPVQVNQEAGPSRCPSPILNQAQVFDGVNEHLVQIQTELDCQGN